MGKGARFSLAVTTSNLSHLLHISTVPVDHLITIYNYHPNLFIAQEHL